MVSSLSSQMGYIKQKEKSMLGLLSSAILKLNTAMVAWGISTLRKSHNVGFRKIARSSMCTKGMKSDTSYQRFQARVELV